MRTNLSQYRKIPSDPDLPNWILSPPVPLSSHLVHVDGLLERIILQLKVKVLPQQVATLRVQPVDVDLVRSIR